MNQAVILETGRSSHPESGRECLRITTNQPWPFGWMTEIWVDPAAPVPDDGAPVQWDHHHAILPSGTWRKLELDSDAGAPLR